MLTPATDASAALAKWVDYGVADALTKGYLASMQFGIASTPDCSQLIEVRREKEKERRNRGWPLLSTSPVVFPLP
jgi:hypothetical protein